MNQRAYLGGGFILLRLYTLPAVRHVNAVEIIRRLAGEKYIIDDAKKAANDLQRR